jgi:hypothetical protein
MIINKSTSICILLWLMLPLFSSISYAQTLLWPVVQQSIPRTISGTLGESRGNNNRYHGGVDINNASQQPVLAVNAGIVNNVLKPASNYYDSRVIIGDLYYWHTIPTKPNGAVVNIGDTIGISSPIAKPHVHLQQGDLNYVNTNLISNLFNFIDNTPPTVKDVKFHQNGLRKDNLTPELSQNISYNNTNYILIYNKIDIYADVTDPRTNSGGGFGGGSCMPYSTSYQVFDYNNNPIFEAIEYIKWDATPLNTTGNNKTRFVFSPNADLSNHRIIITNNPFTSPNDRFWNTGLKSNVQDFNWQTSDIKDAKYPGQAAYNDGVYTVRVISKDRDLTSTPKNSSPPKDIKVLIDNFYPYINKVVLSPNGPSSSIVSQYTWDGTSLQLNAANDSIDGTQNVVIKAFSSEPLKNCSISIPGLNISSVNMDSIVNSNNREWKYVLTSVNMTNLTEQSYTIEFTGQDYNNNALIINPASNMPIRQLNGSWSPSPQAGTNNTFKILFKKCKINDSYANVTSCDICGCQQVYEFDYNGPCEVTGIYFYGSGFFPLSLSNGETANFTSYCPDTAGCSGIINFDYYFQLSDGTISEVYNFYYNNGADFEYCGGISPNSSGSRASNSSEPLLLNYPTLSGLKQNSKSFKGESSAINISLFPNPTNDFTNLNIQSLVDASVQITITDILGRIIKNDLRELSKGSNLITYNLSSFSSGIYFINVDNLRDKQVIKLFLE